MLIIIISTNDIQKAHPVMLNSILPHYIAISFINLHEENKVVYLRNTISAKSFLKFEIVLPFFELEVRRLYQGILWEYMVGGRCIFMYTFFMHL